MFVSKSTFVLLALAGLSASQSVQITGKILERAAMGSVPGAVITWKAANGDKLVRTADTAGNFVMTGDPVSILRGQRALERFEGSLMRNGMLQLRTDKPEVVEASLYDSKGAVVARSTHRLASAGIHSVPVLGDARRSFVGFLRIKIGTENYRLKIFHTGGPSAATHASFAPASSGSLAKQTAAGDTLIVSMDGLVTHKIPNPANSGAIGDIIMEYPARGTIGLGATRPYGAIVLFDGTQGAAAAQAELNAKWYDWRDWTPTCGQGNSSTKNTSPPRFKVAKDPEFPSDTNRVTIRTDVVEGAASRWGCDDIEAKPELYKHGDVQLHVEWVAMGTYDGADPENPNTSTNYGTSGNATYYVNSGVYVQNRYEIQIQSAPFTGNITDCHYMGAIVNEYAPSATAGSGNAGQDCSDTQSPCPGCGASNQLKHNGQWNSYDITFRTSRWNGSTRTEFGYMSMWWNGVKVHHNRLVTAVAGGTQNTSGENMDNQIYGLKLQRERGDVRFRNIWMKHLKIDSTGTNFGY